MSELDPHQEAVLRTIRQAASDVLERGAARLETTRHSYAPPFEYDTVALTLEPTNPRAAAFRVEVWDDTWAISAGKTRHPLERMPGDVPDRHGELAQIVRAVVDGRYEHRYRQARIRLLLRPWRHRSLTEFVGTLHLETGPLEFSHAGLEPPGLETEPVAYEPYLTGESGRG